WVSVLPATKPAPVGPLLIEIVIASVADVITLPDASTTDTWIALASSAPDTTEAGCVLNASALAGPFVMSDDELTPGCESADADAFTVYAVPDRLSDTPVNVATPLTAATCVAPLSVAFPGLLTRNRVTTLFADVARLPLRSCTAICASGERLA